MSTEQTAKKASSSAPKRVFDRVGAMSLEQAYIIFGLIYIPFAILLNNQGLIAEAMLLAYTVAMFIASVVLLGRFVIFFGKLANEHNGRFGDLFVMYVLDGLIPLVMLKVLGFVVYKLICGCHRGIFSEAVEFVRGLMYVLNYQQALNLLILVTVAAFGGFALWSVRKEK